MPKTHGLGKPPIYLTWINMRQRCNNPNIPCFKYYGGRGIKVCKRWNSFVNFYNDLMPSYKKGFELDRIRSNGNYTLNNVQWIPHKRNTQKRKYCKLNYTKAKEIRKSNSSVINLAKLYRVSIGSIRHVLNDRTWI